MSAETRLKELGIEMGPPRTRPAKFVPVVQVGNLLFVSGHTPTIDGRLAVRGKLGDDVSIDQGQELARLAALNCLAAVRGQIGSLDNVARIVRVTGYVASAPGFNDQSVVINGASQVLEEVFGDIGKHARSAIGVAELPGGAPVEIEMIVAVADA